MKAYNGFPPEQRERALRWLNAEYAAGRRTRPTRCDACTQDEGYFQAHSEDYSAPFGANIGEHGLCYFCHMLIHCRFSAPQAWARYRTRIRSGWRVRAHPGQSWGTVQRYLRPAMNTSLLDTIGDAPELAAAASSRGSSAPVTLGARPSGAVLGLT